MGRARFFAGDDLPPDIEAHRLDFRCPPGYLPMILGIESPREFAQVCQKGGDGLPRIIGHTYMDETLCVGTVNRGDFWNQRRSLVAYWGTKSHPIALQARLLHDGYDYSSGLIFTRQKGPCILGAVVFATDSGDRHIALDPIEDRKIVARDMRLRFQIINPPSDWCPPSSLQLGHEANRFRVGNAEIWLQIPFAELSDNLVESRTLKDGMDGCLDVVLYQGAERRVDFAQIRSAAILFGLMIAPIEEVAPPPGVTVEAGKLLSAEWMTPRGCLKLTVSKRPGTRDEHQHLAMDVDGT